MLFTWCLSIMRNRLILFVGAFALIAALTAPSAEAKRLGACSVLAPEDLEPIFERAFRKGITDEAGACLFRIPALARGDKIVVSVIPQRFSSEKRAKQAFAKAERVTTEIGAQVEPVQAGRDSFYSIVVGADLLTMRVGPVVVTVRVDDPDDATATYRDQVIAVGEAVAVRLATAG